MAIVRNNNHILMPMFWQLLVSRNLLFGARLGHRLRLRLGLRLGARLCICLPLGCGPFPLADCEMRCWPAGCGSGPNASATKGLLNGFSKSQSFSETSCRSSSPKFQHEGGFRFTDDGASWASSNKHLFEGVSVAHNSLMSGKSAQEDAEATAGAKA